MKKTHIILLLAIVFVLGMGIMSAGISNRFSGIFAQIIGKMLGFVNLNNPNNNSINNKIREFAHFVEYMTLFTIFFSVYQKKHKNMILQFIIPFAIVFLVAIFDEFVVQQFLTSGRAVELSDVMIDVFGMTVGYINIQIYKFINVLNS